MSALWAADNSNAVGGGEKVAVVSRDFISWVLSECGACIEAGNVSVVAIYRIDAITDNNNTYNN